MKEFLGGCDFTFDEAENVFEGWEVREDDFGVADGIFWKLVDIGVQASEIKIANFFPGFSLVKQSAPIRPPPVKRVQRVQWFTKSKSAKGSNRSTTCCLTFSTCFPATVTCSRRPWISALVLALRVFPSLRSISFFQALSSLTSSSRAIKRAITAGRSVGGAGRGASSGVAVDFSCLSYLRGSDMSSWKNFT